MKATYLLGASLVAAAMFNSPTVALSADYPTRPIEMIVPWGPGGGADQLARLVGKLLETELGVGIPVVNVPGGTGATGMAKLLSTPPDGYSMAIYIADSHALLAGPEARWKIEDLIPVAVMIQAPSFLFAKADGTYKTWADVEAAAKAAPGTLKVATLGFGSVDDFTLKVVADNGISMLQVPFAKPSERYISILGGHADLLYEQAGDVRQFLDDKKMAPLLVFGSERVAEFPEVPSSVELGYDVSLPQFRAIVVRAGTPPEVLETLSAALTKVAESAEFKDFLTSQYARPDSFLVGTAAADYVSGHLAEMKAAAATQ